jgi:hypothetical protein
MNGGYTDSSRTLIYFGICLPFRSLLTYITVKSQSNKNTKLFNFMKLLFFSMGLAFLRNFLIQDKPTHGFFGGKIWWRYTTPIHSLLYLSFVATKNTNLLILDLIVSLLGFFILKP